MKRKLISIILAVFMVIGMVPFAAVPAFAAVEAEYLAFNEITGGFDELRCTNCDVLRADDTSWTSEWYLADGSMIINGRVTVIGNVRLILKDGCALTVNGGIDVSRGILTVLAQSFGENMGKLTAVAEYGNAGIGSSEGEKNLSVIIHGGRIYAEGGPDGGAGIGSSRYEIGYSYNETDGTYVINDTETPGDIVIVGGDITAKGGCEAAGIGGGYGCPGGSVVIHGGKVDAYGGETSDYCAADNADGIGGGYFDVMNGDNIVGSYPVGDGTIHSYNSAEVYSNGERITNEHMHTLIKVPEKAATCTQTGLYTDYYICSGEYGCGKCFASYFADLEITPELFAKLWVVPALGHSFTSGIYRNNEDGTHSQKCVRCNEYGDPEIHTYTKGFCVCGKETDHTHVFDTAWTTDETAHWHVCTADDCYIEDYSTCGLEGAAYGEHIYNNGVCICGRENHRISKTYTDENGVVQPAVDCFRLSDTEAVDDLSFEAGEWYYVVGTFTVNNRIENNAPDDNPAHLILGYGAVMNAAMGIHNPEGKGLVIYTYSASAPGQLNAAAGVDNYAGIGGDMNESGGTVIINGGTVTATGERTSAGIGGGYRGSGGTVTINGGTVTAAGKAAGIGSGGAIPGGTNTGNIRITGGKITAAGGTMGAGIGGGYGCTGGTITITGGEITATGNTNAAGIGGGYGCSGGTITITGGEITAVGSSNAAGIGYGYDSPDFGTFTLGDQLEISAGASEEQCEYRSIEIYRFTRESYVKIRSIPTYTVKHFKQNEDKTGYELAETQMLTGHTGEKTTAAFKEYDGFAPQVFEQQTIKTDGSAVVEIYYKRVGPSHEHTFSTEWSTSETHHWHEAACEHSDLVSGFGAHTFGTDGKCTVCGYEDTGIRAKICTVILTSVDEPDTVLYSGTTDGTNICNIGNVANGTYLMSVSCEGAVTRTYTTEITDGEVTQEVALYAEGDVNGDGVIDANDYSLAVNTALEADTEVSKDLSEDSDYMKAVADLDGDGVVDVIDVALLERKMNF